MAEQPEAQLFDVITDDGRFSVALKFPGEEPPPSNYIPMNSDTLQRKLASRFKDDHIANQLHILSRRAGLRCSLRFTDCFAATESLYNAFDPDQAPVSMTESESRRTPASTFELLTGVDCILDLAGFRPVPAGRILPMIVRTSRLSTDPFYHSISPNSASRVVAYGTLTQSGHPKGYFQLVGDAGSFLAERSKAEEKHWLLPWVSRKVHTFKYDCIIMRFQNYPVPPEPSILGRTLSWIHRTLLPCCSHKKQESSVTQSPYPEAQVASTCDIQDAKAASAFFSSHQHTPTPPLADVPPADRPVQPPVHMRVFTNVAIHDADMLFPGAVAVFTVLDQLLIWVPVLIGVISAIYKVSSSSLVFNPYVDATGFATTIGLVLMPLSYAAQARFAQQRKAETYAAHINEILLMRQRNSNAGAVRWLLDIAAEQEQKEMLLAYTFLWNGQPVPRPVPFDYAKHDVDSAIELFLRGDIKADQEARGSSHGALVDFDMSAALAELIRMKIVTEDKAQGTICAVPVDQAIDTLSIRKYPEDAAEMPYLSGGRRASRLNWTQPPHSISQQLQKKKDGRKSDDSTTIPEESMQIMAVPASAGITSVSHEQA